MTDTCPNCQQPGDPTRIHDNTRNLITCRNVNCRVERYWTTEEPTDE